MNEKIKFIIAVCVAFFFFVFSGIQFYRGKHYQFELAEARLELERVRADALALAERQRAVDGNLERAREIVERQQASVSGGLGTISEIRACIAEIRAYTEMLEDCLRNYDRDNRSNHSGSGSVSGEIKPP
jgi:hypothetical protein